MICGDFRLARLPESLSFVMIWPVGLLFLAGACKIGRQSSWFKGFG